MTMLHDRILGQDVAPCVTTHDELSYAELTSLEEVANGIHQRPIPKEHACRLLRDSLIYRLLGDLRITAKGRTVLKRIKR